MLLGMRQRLLRAHRRLSTLLPDPHNVSATLDTATSAAIVERLEARGKDAIFQSLYKSYFPRLIDAEHVLEVGCGTGVVVRALAREPGFRGKITAIDQSPVFLEAAASLAEQEGVSDRITFRLADGSTAADPGGTAFDAIVMHTLLSHVSEPGEVLAAARAASVPGKTKLFVLDGDYGSLTYAHAEDPDLGRRMDDALVRGVYTSPAVIRELPGLLARHGWRLTGHTSQCVSELGHDVSYWMSFGEAYAPRISASGLVPAEAVDAWWAAQKRAAKDGTFFAQCSYFAVEGVAE